MIRLPEVTQEMRNMAQNYATNDLRLAPDMIWMKVTADLDGKYPHGWTKDKTKNFVISLVKHSHRELICGDAILSAEHITLSMMKDNPTGPFLQ